MRNPIPVTIKENKIDNWSTWYEILTDNAPVCIQVKTGTMTGFSKCSPSISINIRNEKTKEPATANDAIHPISFSNLRYLPNKPITKKPINGNNGINFINSYILFINTLVALNKILSILKTF